MVTNGVPMARHGLIFGADEARAARNLSKPLLGPPAAMFGPKTTQSTTNLKSKHVLYFWPLTPWSYSYLLVADFLHCYASLAGDCSLYCASCRSGSNGLGTSLQHLLHRI